MEVTTNAGKTYTITAVRDNETGSYDAYAQETGSAAKRLVAESLASAKDALEAGKLQIETYG